MQTKEEHKENARAFVPKHLRHLVCTCYTWDDRGRPYGIIKPHPKSSDPDSYAKSCCGKYAAWGIRICASCRMKYLAKFRHPKQCHHISMCYNCLESEPAKVCTNQKWLEYVETRQFFTPLHDFLECEGTELWLPDPRIIEEWKELTLAEIIANAKKVMGSD